MSLMRKLWDDERFVNDNTLSVNVNRLRQQLRGNRITTCYCNEKRPRIYGGNKRVIFYFLREHMAWLGFYVLVLVISNLILYLDTGFSQVSFLYFNVVQIVLLVLFCLTRFWKKCQQVKMLNENTTVR